MNGTNPITIAVAEDHTIVRKGLVELINTFSECSVVLDAVNGQELIEKIQQAPAPPDVVLIDINMPRMNGYDTANHLKKHWPGIKILALSMLNEEFAVIRMLRSGAHGFITKDCDPMELSKALLGVYRNSFYHSDLVTGKLIHGLHVEETKANDITQPELEFLAWCCTDFSYKEIAEKMYLSQRTVEGYRDNLFKKLNTRTRVGLVVFALRNGLTS